MTPVGRFCLVLHSHLPYVISHGRWPHGMDWLSEAAAETYIPLIRELSAIQDEGIDAKITIGLSPVLCEQLDHPAFDDEFSAYLTQKTEAARDDGAYFARTGESEMATLADYWLGWYESVRDFYENRCGRNITGAFRRLQDDGAIEIITCGATHGYFPLLSLDESIQAQVKCAVSSHERRFGRRPRGIWMPECAYRPRYRWSPPTDAPGDWPHMRKGVEEFLSQEGLDYTFVDTALLRGGKAMGVYLDRFEGLRQLWDRYLKEAPPHPTAKRTPREVYMLAMTPEGKPTSVFTRDPDTGLTVWSGEHGYPGEGEYLDFHKKRFPGGLRYWRVTHSQADLADKLRYVPDRAASRVPNHASHFVDLVRGLMHAYQDATGRTGVLCAPFDAELFGHWWFEGPSFIGHVLRLFAEKGDVAAATCAEHYDADPPTELVAIPEGSWGEGGYHTVWLNEDTEWTWKHIYEDEAFFARLCERYADSDDGLLIRLLKQAARELMLEQASDWQFLITTWSARDYAELRLTRHHEDFERLARTAEEYAENGELSETDRAFLEEMEKRDPLFPDVDPKWWAGVEHPAGK
jgi:1,4-alpha-glucan branching enzyme